MNKHHPNIWHLLAAVRNVQESSAVSWMQINAGQDVISQKWKYMSVEKRIQNLYASYDSGRTDVIEIMGISHTIK